MLVATAGSHLRYPSCDSFKTYPGPLDDLIPHHFLSWAPGGVVSKSYPCSLHGCFVQYLWNRMTLSPIQSRPKISTFSKLLFVLLFGEAKRYMIYHLQHSRAHKKFARRTLLSKECPIWMVWGLFGRPERIVSNKHILVFCVEWHLWWDISINLQ